MVARITNTTFTTFLTRVKAGNFPAVSYLKSAAYRDGHAGYSDPLDEQAFLVHVINTIEQTPQWSSTVIIITYDDSDGWYDHVHNIVNGSATAHDTFSSAGKCGDPESALPGVNPGTLHAQGRCGYGPRLPLLVISPWAKPNYVSHTVTDQSSVSALHRRQLLASAANWRKGLTTHLAGSIDDMLDRSGRTPKNGAVILLDDTTGEVISAK